MLQKEASGIANLAFPNAVTTTRPSLSLWKELVTAALISNLEGPILLHKPGCSSCVSFPAFSTPLLSVVSVTLGALLLL